MVCAAASPTLTTASWCLLCLPLERFHVFGPSGPIVAELGKDATLPCSLFPVMSAENMELRWFRSNVWESVFTYQDRQERHEELMAQYAGRTSLVGKFLSEGEASVIIHEVQAADNGLYTCFFSNGVLHGQASLELQVAGVGSAPQVHILGPEEDGVRVVCTASGWFPEPQVQWRHLHGEQFLEFSKAQAQDNEGLFSVEAALVVRDSSAGSVTCSILNPILGQEKAMAIVIPAWRKAQLYADWRKEQFQAWPVTLDPDSCSHEIVLSHDKTSLTCHHDGKGGEYTVLGLEGITSGRCYWEVEVKSGDRTQWGLGVWRKDEKNRYSANSPLKGKWVIGQYNYIFQAFTDPDTTLPIRQFPHRVGVFLDYDHGDVSFYDMTDGSHIFSFPPESFSGALLPYFACYSGDVSMTLCPLEAGPQKPSVPMNNPPSLEEPTVSP
ncbi:butyrophilin subfamily 1 member A1-like [Talpa occidentalis]|uniref:butyrophilin subfamily 1 member A1-like n=1 Tax=Talpa occidentalis TaxID=50954 RepID=UPI0023F7ABDD|nr:butyrophilin subfamily 1 member A1-like [Talpa occidentalis]